MAGARKPKGGKPKASKKFIQGMHLKKGALHQDLGIPTSKKIPQATLEAAAKRPGIVGKRARTAEMLEGLHKGKKKGRKKAAK